MISYPPKCSRDWTDRERIALASWCTQIMRSRIERDNPAMPLISKQPVYDLVHCIHAILTGPASQLEANRKALEKPYDSACDHNEFWIIGDPSQVLKHVLR